MQAIATDPTVPQPPQAAATERWLLCAVASLAILLLSPSPLRSPDGMEVIARLAAGHFDLDQWPPLWPALVWLGEQLGDPVVFAWLIGLMSTAATTVPIYRLGSAMAGPVAARFAVLTWGILPAVRYHAAVLDARPLSWLMLAWTAALVAEAGRGWRSWWWALVPAAAAPLCRPDAVAAIPLVLIAALALGGPLRRVALGAVIASLPMLAVKLVIPAGRGEWEALYLPWASTWSGMDFVSLMGAATAQTDFRRFAISALETGIEHRPSSVLDLIVLVPAHTPLLLAGLLRCTGALALVLALAGALILTGQGWKRLALLAAVIAPVLGLLLLPMAWLQATLEANLLWTTALTLPAAGVTLAWAVDHQQAGRRECWMGWLAPVLLAAAVGAEAHLGPVVSEPPQFLESTACADRMVEQLRADPPASGQVACTFTGRSLVRRAGLTPIALPSRWEDWQPPDDVGALLASIDLGGGTGGRALDMLMDPRWELRATAQDQGGGQDPAEASIFGPKLGTEDRPPDGSEGHELPQMGLFWFAYLGRRPAP